MLLKDLFSKSYLEFQSSNIFASQPLSDSDNDLLEGAVHFKMENATSRNPKVNVLPFS